MGDADEEAGGWGRSGKIWEDEDERGGTDFWSLIHSSWRPWSWID